MNILSYLTPKSATFFLDNNATVRQALEKFDIHKFSIVPLIDENGKFVSTISEGDLLRFIKNNCNFDIKMAENTRISAIEKYRPYKALKISTPKEEIIRLSLEQNFVPIIDDRGAYIGIIKRKTIIDHLFNS